MREVQEMDQLLNMVGDNHSMEEFLRRSMEKNEMEAKLFIMEEHAKKIKSLSNINGLPLLFKDKTFNNFVKSKNALGFNAARSFVDSFPNSKGLLFSAGVGLGKTHLAAAIVNELNQKLYSTYFGNIVDIVSFVKSTYNKDSCLSEVEAINLMTSRVDLLVIDDLGKENNTEYTISLLYQIINKLYENKKAIIITTNYSASDLSKKLGERGQAIVSRICAMCSPVILTGEDWRINHESL